MTDQTIRICILFSDAGAFHTQDLTVPAAVVRDYDHLIDGLREDPDVLKMVHLDITRLAAAWVSEEE